MSIFCSIEVTLGGFLDDSWMGAGNQKESVLIRVLEFLALLPSSRGRRGAANGINIGSCLLDEASIVGSSESFQAGDTSTLGG